MGDSELVTSIVAGDPEGLAAAYDKYAADLYGYCRTLLREPDDAADAVQDTFVIAASKLAGLRDPGRLRAWLFAVARNECLRRLKSRRQATPLQDAPEVADDSADVSAGAERAETVALVRAAIGGLNDSERDAITQLWHGLEVSEVAAVLGVSRNHAYALFSRAREQFAASVAVLLVGRAGRGDCAVLDGLLGDWDGRLTARLRRRVGRHIDQCPVCSDRRRQELTPALLYDIAPGALLGMAASQATWGGAGALSGPLADVRAEMLRLTAGAPAPRGSAGRRRAQHALVRCQRFPSAGAPRSPGPAAQAPARGGCHYQRGGRGGRGCRGDRRRAARGAGAKPPRRRAGTRHGGAGHRTAARPVRGADGRGHDGEDEAAGRRPPASTTVGAPAASPPLASGGPSGPTATPSTTWPTGAGAGRQSETATATTSAPATLTHGTLTVFT